MFRVAVVLALASVLLTALALISCLSVTDRREIRGAPRTVWVLAILLIPLGGAIGWFLLGRPRPALPPGAGRRRPAGPRPEPPRPRAPDDDPEFLRSLDHRTLSADEERSLRKWEEDLRRRDDERRRPEPGTDG
jgi:hypothetical protein